MNKGHKKNKSTFLSTIIQNSNDHRSVDVGKREIEIIDFLVDELSVATEPIFICRTMFDEIIECRVRRRTWTLTCRRGV